MSYYINYIISCTYQYIISIIPIMSVYYINYNYYINYTDYISYFSCFLFFRSNIGWWKWDQFLFEYHSCRFETLDLPTIPDDRSQFDVHGALEDDKVKQLESTWYIFATHDAHDFWYFMYYSNYIYYVNYCYYI